VNLWNEFLQNKGDVIHKWHHYFPLYEKYFSPWKNKSLTFLEIGVQNGGSTNMWRRYFGPHATIVGIDIEPKCKRVEKDGINIRIGDQSDPAFLQSLIDEFGIPDIVLDDGSHIGSHVSASFQFLYPKMHKNAIYFIEDMHVQYNDIGYWRKDVNFVEVSKNHVDDMHAAYRNVQAASYIQKDTLGIHFHNGVIVYEKGDMRNVVHSRVGTTIDELI